MDEVGLRAVATRTDNRTDDCTFGADGVAMSGGS